MSLPFRVSIWGDISGFAPYWLTVKPLELIVLKNPGDGCSIGSSLLLFNGVLG